ncbi:MAG: hypothetical protein AAF399_01865 [Bacteroidota bacterium]
MYSVLELIPTDVHDGKVGGEELLWWIDTNSERLELIRVDAD